MEKIEKTTISLKKILNLWVPPLLWAGYIYKLSSGPVASVSSDYWQEFTIKSFAHVLFFAILTILVYRALKGGNWINRKAGYTSILFSFFYAITDEIHQSLVPVRDARVHDVIFDTMGAIIAVYLIWNLLPLTPTRLKSWAKKLDLI